MNFKSQKGITLISLVIIIGIILLGIVIIYNNEKGYKLNNKGEAVAYTSIRLASTQSKLGNGKARGYGTITRDQFNTLGKMVKNANSNNKWFSDVKQGVSVLISDTSEKQIVTISYGDYVATLTVDNSTKDYYLVDYKFENKKSNSGYIVIITD